MEENLYSEYAQLRNEGKDGGTEKRRDRAHGRLSYWIINNKIKLGG